MLVHFKDNSQISERVEVPKFELPKYPESTTDPTYYEPTATRIANMKRSAGAFQGLYDFTGSAKTSKEALSQLVGSVVDSGYLGSSNLGTSTRSLICELSLKCTNIIFS